jgi:hypothetical protein
MDEFSDLDLVVLTDPSLFGEAPDRRRALAASLGTLLAAFSGEHVFESRLLICLYGPPLVHVDLKFVTPDGLASRVEDPIVLWDRDGRFRDALRSGSARYPAPDPHSSRIASGSGSTTPRRRSDAASSSRPSTRWRSCAHGCSVRSPSGSQRTAEWCALPELRFSSAAKAAATDYLAEIAARV